MWRDLFDLLSVPIEILYIASLYVFQSLLSKMKDSMKDMLTPSWLTELVHNVKQDSPAKDIPEVFNKLAV